MSQYHLDLEQFDLDWLRSKLESEEIVPARKILKEKTPERFAVLRAAGIENLKDLVAALRTKEKVERFSRESGLSKEYLVWLGREARSYLPNPFALRDIPWIDPDVIGRLEDAGIKTTKRLFDRAAAKEDRAALARATGAPLAALLELVKLSDLARVRGMGRTFVRLFYEAGVDSLQALSKWDPKKLFDHIHAVNSERKLSSVVPSLKDVTQYVEMARELPKVIEVD